MSNLSMTNPMYSTPTYIHSHETLYNDFITNEVFSNIKASIDPLVTNSLKQLDYVDSYLNGITNSNLRQAYENQLKEWDKNNEILNKLLELREAKYQKKLSLKGKDGKIYDIDTLYKIISDNIIADKEINNVLLSGFQDILTPKIVKAIGKELTIGFTIQKKDNNNDKDVITPKQRDLALKYTDINILSLSNKELLALIQKDWNNRPEKVMLSQRFERIVKRALVQVIESQRYDYKLLQAEIEDNFKQWNKGHKKLTTVQQDMKQAAHDAIEFAAGQVKSKATLDAIAGFMYEEIVALHYLKGVIDHTDIGIEDLQYLGNTNDAFTSDIAVKLKGFDTIIGQSLKSVYQHKSGEIEESTFSKSAQAMTDTDFENNSNIANLSTMNTLLTGDTVKVLTYLIVNEYALSQFCAVENFDSLAHEDRIIINMNKNNPMQNKINKENYRYRNKKENYDSYDINDPAIHSMPRVSSNNYMEQIRYSIAILSFIKALLGSAFTMIDFDKDANIAQALKNQGAPLILKFMKQDYWTADIIHNINDLISKLDNGQLDMNKLAQFMPSEKNTYLEKLKENLTEAKLQNLFLLKKMIAGGRRDRIATFLAETPIAPRFSALASELNLSGKNVVSYLQDLTKGIASEDLKKYLLKKVRFSVPINEIVH